MILVRLALAATLTSALGDNVTKPALLCAEVSSSNFNPDCLPPELKDFSDIGDQEKPYIYLQWMFAETCGPYMAHFKRSFHTLPEVMSLAVTSVFLNWGIYVLGNFIGVGIMNVFEVAPRGRRCCGLFAEGSLGYKTLVGPLYYLLFVYAIVLLVALMWRFWSEVHKFRSEAMMEAAAGGLWPVKDGTDYDVPEAPAACRDALNLIFPAYKDIFQVLVLMVFTGVDLVMLLTMQCWVCILTCIVQCRCLCCYCCKGCCGILGWLICNQFAMMCCLVIPFVVLALYYFLGVLAACVYYGLFVLVLSIGVLLLGYAVRYLLCLASCGICRPLAIPYDEQKTVLFPFPPGGLFKRTKALGALGSAEMTEEDAMMLQQAQMAQAMGAQLPPEFQKFVDEKKESAWSANLGVPNKMLQGSFPAFYAIVTVPQIIIFNLVFACWIGKAFVVFSKSYSESNLDWFSKDNGPTSVWPFNMQIIKAMFVGITNGLHAVFVDGTMAIFTDFTGTIKGLWEGAILGMDPSNLFSSNFTNFMAAILMGRLFVTLIFVCLRLTAVINRVTVEGEVASRDGSEFDAEEDYEYDE